MIDMNKINELEICEIEDIIDLLCEKVEEKEKKEGINKKAIIEDKLHNELGIPERFKLSIFGSGRLFYFYGKSLDIAKLLRDESNSYLKECINPETVEALKMTDVILNNVENSEIMVPTEIYGFDTYTGYTGYTIKLRDTESNLGYKVSIIKINDNYRISKVLMTIDDFFYISSSYNLTTIDNNSGEMDPDLESTDFYYTINLEKFNSNFMEYDSVVKEVCKILKEGLEQLKNKFSSRLCK